MKSRALVRSFSEFLNESLITVYPSEAATLVKILSTHIGKKEVGNNSGEMVKSFLSSVGLGTGYPWCMAFVYAMFNEFCKSTLKTNPLPKTAAVRAFWDKSPSENKIPKAAAISNPSLVKPGQIFIKSRKGGGHTGIVLRVEGDSFISIDGNSSDSVKLNRYKMDKMIGFVDFIKNPAFSAELSNLSALMIQTHSPSLGGGKET